MRRRFIRGIRISHSRCSRYSMPWKSHRDRLVPVWFLVLFSLSSIAVVIYSGYTVYSSITAVKVSPVAANTAPLLTPLNTSPLNTFAPSLVPSSSTLPPSVSPRGSTGDNVAAAFDTALLRALLIEGGIPKSELDKLDDAALRAIYEKTLREFQK